jgi:hypothetical protein
MVTTSGSAATVSRLSTGRSSSPTSVEPSNSGFLDYAEANQTSAAKMTPKSARPHGTPDWCERHPSGLGPLRKDELRFHAGTVEAADIGFKARNALQFAQHAQFTSVRSGPMGEPMFAPRWFTRWRESGDWPLFRRRMSQSARGAMSTGQCNRAHAGRSGQTVHSVGPLDAAYPRAIRLGRRRECRVHQSRLKAAQHRFLDGATLRSGVTDHALALFPLAVQVALAIWVQEARESQIKLMEKI